MTKTAVSSPNSRDEIERSLRLVQTSSLISPETRQASTDVIVEALKLVDSDKLGIAEAALLTTQVMGKVLSEMQANLTAERTSSGT